MSSVQKLVYRLRTEGEKTVAFFQALSPPQLERVIYTDGAEWRVRDVLAHLTQAEDSLRRLIEGVVQGHSAGTPEDFDLDEYNRRKVQALRALPVAELLREFQVRRERTQAMVAALTAEDLNKQGRHPFLGRATVEEMLKLMYRHEQIHRRDIRRLLNEARHD